MHVIIAGGGIGGLTAAMVLHHRGIEVTLYEAAADLRPLGVGINILPHAMVEFHQLGIMDNLLALGVATAELCFFNRHGQLIWREPRGTDAGYVVPQLSVHRGRLQVALRDHAVRMLPADSIRPGHAFTSCVSHGDGGVDVELMDRAHSTTVTDHGDVLIAADGIHSTVRKQFHPSEGPPHWSGNILWRAISRAKPFLTGRSMFMAGHLPHKFVAYPISAVGDDGLCDINWIAELDRTALGPPGREDWNKRGVLDDFLPRFQDWRYPWIDIPALITAAPSVYEFPMVDRDPLDTWTYGSVTLLGDAAHPMYPVGSNGASQAVLDARAIGDALAQEPTIAGALERYEADRRMKTAALVMMNRQHGPERVLDMAEQRSPAGFTDIGDVFAEGELEAVSAEYKQVAGLLRSPLQRTCIPPSTSSTSPVQ